MYKQVLDPVGDSLLASALVAAIPIVVLFVLLGGLKMKAHWASLIALARCAPRRDHRLLDAGRAGARQPALEGAAFGFFPIMYIVFVALWIYNMTVETGHFAVLRRAFNRVSDDQRVQAVIIAFSFGALLEALAGFGTPVAITAVMLIALGFEPIKAASVALVANTAPVAFGAIAIPIVTLARGHRPPQGRPRRDGRPPDAAAGAGRAADPRRHGRRRARHPPGVARRGRRRLHVRASASSCARTTSRSSSPTSSPRCSPPARSSRSCRSGARPSRCTARPTAAARGPRSRAPRWPTPPRGRGQPQGGQEPRHARRDRRRLLALPVHHRSSSRSPSTGRSRTG